MTPRVADLEHLPDNLTTWLELKALELGTENQRERWLAHLLPDDELTQLARAELYRPFGDTKRWKNVSQAQADRDIRHSTAENMERTEEIRFVTQDVAELTHDEWERLKAIQKLAEAVGLHPWLQRSKVTPVVAARSHRATCAWCGGTVTYQTALVTIEWAGRMLTREYAL